MYALVNPEVLIPESSYQYRVVSVLADPAFDALAAGMGFEKWEATGASFSQTSTISLKAAKIPASVSRYKLVSQQGPTGKINNQVFLITPNGDNLPESFWKERWAELLQAPAALNTAAYRYFQREGLIHPRPWYLTYGYAGLGGAALGVILLSYGLFRLARRKG